MRKISLIVAMIALLVGIPVQAQKIGKGPTGPPTPEPAIEVSLKDDGGAGYLVFNLKSGAFTCNVCEYGYVLTGFGEVKVDGCNVHFSAITKDYRMFATVNMCEHQGKTSVAIFSFPESKFDILPMYEDWSDSDLRDSKPECNSYTTK